MAAALAAEPGKFAPAAAGTIASAGRVELDLSHRVIPQIEHRPDAADGFQVTAEDFQSFIAFERGDHADDRRENAGAIARGRGARRRGLGHEAAEASGLAGDN